MIHNYATHSEELKPCPFCGEKPLWYYSKTDKGNFSVTIECLHCQVKMKVGSIRNPLEWAVNQAKTKWNCRTTRQ